MVEVLTKVRRYDSNVNYKTQRDEDHNFLFLF